MNRLQQMFVSGAMCLAIFFPIKAPAQIPGVPNTPKIPGMLPNAASVPATSPMPVDGTWLIQSTGKKLRIEGGRAYAVDSWVHMFVFQINPGMVITRNVKPTGPGKYSAESLIWMGGETWEIQADRNIAGVVQGVPFTLVPVQLDNPQWYAQEMEAAGLTPENTAPGSGDGYQFTPPPGDPGYDNPGDSNPPPAADCEEQLYDPRTGQITCAD